MLVAIALTLSSILIIREMQLKRARVLLLRHVEDLRLSQQSIKDGSKRLAEDVFVLQNLLLERNLLQQSELLRARGRLIEQPRRKAAERNAMLKHVGAEKSPFVLEDAEGHVH